MRKHYLPYLCAATLIVAPGIGYSQTGVEPGLWELTQKVTSKSGKVEQGITQLQQQLASLPEDQRKQMEKTLNAQGLSFTPDGGQRVKLCMTDAIAKKFAQGVQQDGDCKTTLSPSENGTAKMKVECTESGAKGEGVITIANPHEYSMHMVMYLVEENGQDEITTDSVGKWLDKNCGDVTPPPTAPEGN